MRFVHCTCHQCDPFVYGSYAPDKIPLGRDKRTDVQGEYSTYA